jgi:hypothetical protein
MAAQVLLAMLLTLPLAALADMEIEPRVGANKTEGRAARRWVQQNERAEGEGGVGERLIDRVLANAKLTTELGLTEETVTRLREESRALQVRQIELDAQIRKLSLEQTDRMAKLLLASDANTNEVMKTVEALGRLRTEQAKLTVQHLMAVRRHLTPEQIRRARELMHDRAQKNAENRARKEKAPAPAAGPLPPKPPEGW